MILLPWTYFIASLFFLYVGVTTQNILALYINLLLFFEFRIQIERENK